MKGARLEIMTPVLRIGLQAIKIVLNSLGLLLVVLVIMFVLLQLTPGDPVQALVGRMPVPKEFEEQMAQAYGLNDPVHIQFVKYIWNVLQFDFGHSYANNQDVMPLIIHKLWNTALIVLPALVIASIVGTLFGLISGVSRSRTLDNSLASVSLGFFSIPNFWLGLLFILLFSTWLGVLPSQGMGPFDSDSLSISNMVLPVITITAAEAAFMFRIMRASVLEVLSSDFIDTARSKGLSWTSISLRHVLKNAFLPMTSVIGYSIGFILAGSVLVERVFSWPGVGMLLYDSIQNSENMVIMGILFVMAIIVLVANLLTDVVYTFIDPRLRSELF